MALLGAEVPCCGNTTPVPQEGLAETPIQEFYNGATVLVTGGTGFVGQLIIEKLLRSCPGVKKIYVLTRPKKNKDQNTRMREQFKNELYDKLRAVDPNFEDKVETVAGDCGELGLGISNDEKSTLMDEISVIFHCAATVRFDEPLRVAATINTRGTREMIALARECRHLKALVHVSTAYSNCNRSVIEERYYNVDLPGEKLIDLVDNMNEDALNRITPSLIGAHPNTYTYTKKAAEDIMSRHGQDIPCCVVRPSIIIGTAHEPLDGWFGNIYGLGGLFCGIGMGIIHTTPLASSTVLDVVPCDYVSNNCIAAGWQTARLWRKNAAVEPPVYMCGSSPVKPLLLRDLVSLSKVYYKDFPPAQALYSAKFVGVPTPIMYRVLSFFYHWLPAYLADALMMLLGKKPQFKRVYAKVEQLSTVVSQFSLRTWVFSSENTTQLFESMSKSDQRIFNFDFAALDWNVYMKTFVKGIRVYLLKDPLDTLPQGQRRRLYLEVFHYVVCSVVVLFVYGMFKLLSVLFS